MLALDQTLLFCVNKHVTVYHFLCIYIYIMFSSVLNLVKPVAYDGVTCASVNKLHKKIYLALED